MKKHFYITSKFVAFLLVTAFSLAFVLGCPTFADAESASFDSFAVNEECRAPVEYLNNAERQNKKEFWQEVLFPIILKLVLFFCLVQLAIALPIVGIVLIIIFLRRKKKKNDTG